MEEWVKLWGYYYHYYYCLDYIKTKPNFGDHGNWAEATTAYKLLK